MILTKEIIYDRIKDSGYPFWSLFLQQGFKNQSHIMTYTGNDFEENDSDETKIQKSISRLDNIVTSIPNATYIIEIKNSKTANGNGVIGPFQFSNVVKEETPVQQSTALSGIQVSDSYLKGIEERLTNEFNLKLETFKAEEKQKQYLKELEKREEDLKAKEKELSELKKGYESSVAKTADILVLAGQKIAMHLIPNLMPGGVENPEIQLSGNQQPESNESEEEQPTDEKADAVNELAEYLYKNYDTKRIRYFFEDIVAHDNEQNNTEENELD